MNCGAVHKRRLRMNEVMSGVEDQIGRVSTVSRFYEKGTAGLLDQIERPFDGVSNVSDVAVARFGAASGLLSKSMLQGSRLMSLGSRAFQGDAGAAADEPIQVRVIFGGLKNDAPSSDLWVSWNRLGDQDHKGESWYRIDPENPEDAPSLYDPRTALIGKLGRLYVFGGWDASGAWKGDIKYYSSSDNRWHDASVPGLIPEGYQNYEVLDDDARGEIVVFGGALDYGTIPIWRTAIYNPAAGTVKNIGTIGIPGLNRPLHRYDYSYSLKETTHSLVIFGGYSLLGNTLLNDTWSVDLNTGDWTLVDELSLGRPRPQSKAVLMPGSSDDLFLMDGIDANGNRIFEPTWQFGNQGTKGWIKDVTPFEIEANNTTPVLGQFQVTRDVEYRIELGGLVSRSGQAVKVYMMDQQYALDLEVKNELDQVVAEGVEVHLSDVLSYKTATFIAMPGVKYIARIKGDTSYKGTWYGIVATTATPELRSTKSLSTVGGFDIDDGYLYVTTANALRIYRIGVDGSLSDAGIFNFSRFYTARDVVVDNGYAFVALSGVGIQVLKISNPAKPVLVTTVPLTGPCYSIAKNGKMLYVANGFYGVDLVSIDTSGATPVVTWEDNRFVWDFAYRVNTYAGKLIVSELLNGLEVLHIKDMGRLKHLSYHRTSAVALNAGGNGMYLYSYLQGGKIEVSSLGDLYQLEKLEEYSSAANPVNTRVWRNGAVINVGTTGVTSFYLQDDVQLDTLTQSLVGH